MEVSLLEDFLAVAHLGGFTRAAEHRNVTQPAFSRRIRALEDWVGTPLFDRSTHRVVMTDAGRVFYPVAEAIVRRLMQVKDEVGDRQKSTSVMLTFASTHTLAYTFFSGWLAAFHDRVYEKSVRLLPCDSETCEELLRQGTVEFYLGYHHPAVPERLHEPEFVRYVIGKDRLVPVSLPAADGKPIFELPGSSQRPVPHLEYGSKSGIRRIVTAVLQNQPTPVWLREQCEVTIGLLIKPLVLRGWGVAWLLESLIRNELEQGELVMAGDEKWIIDVDICICRATCDQPRTTDEFWREMVTGTGPLPLSFSNTCHPCPPAPYIRPCHE